MRIENLHAIVPQEGEDEQRKIPDNAQKAQELVNAYGFLHVDLRGGSSSVFQGMSRVLALSRDTRGG